ncbi:uncharacterized protein LOC135695692 [Rhopilema esculentum]|uniref:uncharacterized protein LOC135695692 n=1 Tax=Rhopilema esculentum TaxID=499914 RepID=UPI0031E45778|eukprot:gene11331-21522_t
MPDLERIPRSLCTLIDDLWGSKGEGEHPSRIEIERLTAGLRDKLKVLRDIDQEIFDLVNYEEVEAEVISSEDWQSEIHANLIELGAKKSEISKIDEQNTEGSQSYFLASTTSSDHIANLLRLHLPKFAGDPRKWQEFWDSFDIVEGNSSFSPVNKFGHLKTLLEGEAAAAISGISTTGANYEIALKLLKDRFAQKKIVNFHVEALMHLRSVVSDKDVKGLRKLVDEIDTNIRSLQSLGYDLEQYGPFLNPMIMSKLPDEIRITVTKLMQSGR